MQYKSYGSVAFSAHSTFYVSLARLLEFSGFLWTSSSFHYIGVSQNKLGGMVCAIENLASNFVTFVKNSFKIENLVQLRSEAWKSGLASEAITRVPGQLEQNGQVLRIPYNICLNLVYIRVLCVEN